MLRICENSKENNNILVIKCYLNNKIIDNWYFFFLIFKNYKYLSWEN